MILQTKKIKTDLIFLIGIVIILLIIGLLFIYSSSSVFALEKLGSAHYFFKKQLMGLGLVYCSIFFIRLIPIELIKKVCPIFFLSHYF